MLKPALRLARRNTSSNNDNLFGKGKTFGPLIFAFVGFKTILASKGIHLKFREQFFDHQLTRAVVMRDTNMDNFYFIPEDYYTTINADGPESPPDYDNP